MAGALCLAAAPTAAQQEQVPNYLKQLPSLLLPQLVPQPVPQQEAPTPMILPSGPLSVSVPELKLVGTGSLAGEAGGFASIAVETAPLRLVGTAESLAAPSAGAVSRRPSSSGVS